MLVFGTTPDIIPQEFLLKNDIKNIQIYNLSSPLCGYQDLQPLIPYGLNIRDAIEGDGIQFDMQYAEYLLNNETAFVCLMNIVFPVFADPSNLIFVLISASTLRDIIAESLAKFIQQRYGYCAPILACPEDFFYVNEPTFNIAGLYNMDADKLRYASIIGRSDPNAFGSLD